MHTLQADSHCILGAAWQFSWLPSQKKLESVSIGATWNFRWFLHQKKTNLASKMLKFWFLGEDLQFRKDWPQNVFATQEILCYFGALRQLRNKKKRICPQKCKIQVIGPQNHYCNSGDFVFVGLGQLKEKKDCPPPKFATQGFLFGGGGRQVVFNSGRGVGSKVSEIPPAKK